MTKFFYYRFAALFLATLFAPISAQAGQKKADCDVRCEARDRARARSPFPTDKQLVCYHFTLPGNTGKVLIEISKGNQLVLRDKKQVTAREGAFCYPRNRIYGKFGIPDKLLFCDEHSVQLHGDEIDSVVSPSRHNKPDAYACMRGVAGCGGTDKVSLPVSRL